MTKIHNMEQQQVQERQIAQSQQKIMDYKFDNYYKSYIY